MTPYLMKLGKRLAMLYNFRTDGCTGVPELNYEGKLCCYEHDAYYFYKRDIMVDAPLEKCPPISRSEADSRFRRCLKREGLPFWSAIYYTGVRVFGGQYW